MMSNTSPWTTSKPTAVLVLADGTVIEGIGCGATGSAEAEICFNTAITGYQEILTDPSYASQIVTFTFPHIGNVGANDQDIETLNAASSSGVVGTVLKANITDPSNYRSGQTFSAWLASRGIIGMCNVDTRALTALIREKGLANAVIAHAEDGKFDIEALQKRAADWHGLEGLDLAKTVTCAQRSDWSEGAWQWEEQTGGSYQNAAPGRFKVVAIDYGVKRNILRLMADLECDVVVVPAETPAEDILALKPDGIFLSNGPGDPAATGLYSTAVIQHLIDANLPIFGICLGHQMLALALGAKTTKMHQGHHGANHPVKDHTTGKVEIVSMNHGFAVDSTTLPPTVEETHISLFDGSNCGLQVKGKPIFSVQHHPEASPGPQDSHYLFKRFVNTMRVNQGLAALSES